MSKRQPTLREAERAVADIHRTLSFAKEARPAEWEPAREETYWQAASPLKANGFWVRYERARYWEAVRWPMSRIDKHCDDCECALQDRRDGGCALSYDPRWLISNPAARDPRASGLYQPRYVCRPCWNRVRPRLRQAEAINENRLMIGRLKREMRNAA
jgi:hypothetical protein